MVQKRKRGHTTLARYRIGIISTLFLFLSFLNFAVRAQSVDPLAQEYAEERIEVERIAHLLRMQEITPQEHQQRYNQLGVAIRNTKVEVAKRPRNLQPAIWQQSESIFQVRVVPLREQWKQQEIQFQQQLQARDAKRRQELTTDAERAGKYQANRALLAEKLQRGEISQGDFSREDKAAEQEVFSLQQKYDAYGPNWGSLFSGTVAQYTQKDIAEFRRKGEAEKAEREAQLGRDVQQAADITLSIKRNEVFRAQQAISAQEEQNDNASLQSRVASIEAKYRGTPLAANFSDRVSQLVQKGVNDRTPQWVREAASFKLSAQTRPPQTPNPIPSTSGSGGQIPTRPGGGYRPPTPYPYPPRAIPAKSNPWGWVVLFALLGGSAGYYFLFQRRQPAAPAPHYVNIKEKHPVPPMAAVEKATSSGSGKVSSASVQTGGQKGLKDRLFAEQRAKYQARYNDAADESTNASAQLSQMGGIAKEIQNNLNLLSKAIDHRVEALVIARQGNTGKLIMSSMLLRPIWRLFRRAGIFIKLGILVGACFVGAWVLDSLKTGDLPSVIVAYAIVAAVSFFIERYMQLKAPLAAFKKNAEGIKDLSLGYIYQDQQPYAGPKGEPSLHAVRINSVAKSSPVEEFVLPAGADPARSLGQFMLRVGTIAMYRFEPNGGASLAWANPDNPLMQNYGSLLTEALNEQKAFVQYTFPPLQEYGDVVWRRRRFSDQLPHFQRLVDDVKRMENVWRDTYVSDKVFEFLLRRIDLFNMRDSATPPGLLLYGYPGNGKAHLAERVAKSISAYFEEVNPAAMSAAGIAALWEKHRGKEPIVLFLDNAERALNTKDTALAWITEWAKQEPRQSRIWVILAAQSEKDLDPSILKQIGGSKIEVAPPDTAGRELVLRSACRKHELPSNLPSWLVESTGGLSVQELIAVVQDTKLQCVPDPPTDEHWEQAIRNVTNNPEIQGGKTYTWEHLILPADIKEKLIGACTLLKNVERFKKIGADIPNIVLFGPPGTGKTEVARTIASQAKVKFVTADLSELKGSKVGQSAPLVRQVFTKARAAAPAVLFIDEIENIVPKRTGENVDPYTKDIIQQMLTEMDGARSYDRPVFVLAATNHVEMIDPAILRRFSSQISIPLPDDAGRRAILKNLILDRRDSVDPALNVDEVCALLSKRLEGKSGSALRDLVKNAVQNAVTAAVANNISPDEVKLTRELLLAEVMPKGRAVSEEKLQEVWSQIVLKPDVKESILSMIRLFNAADPGAPDGLLLYGSPGTGKTEIARCISKSTSSHFMEKKGSDLTSQYSGQAAHFVSKVWEEARSHPRCVLFVDECEGVFARRGGLETSSEKEDLVREFIAQWDGMNSGGKVWVIGATNQHDRLDPAVISRFGPAIQIGQPGAAERRQILQLEMKKLERTEEVPEAIGNSTNGLAGRDLKQVTKSVYNLAAQRKTAITSDLWEEAIASFRKAKSAKVGGDARWETLVLAEDTLKKLQNACETLRQIELVQKQGIDPPRGGLLYGPPGTGKTQVARTMANESGLTFIEAKLSDLKKGFVGHSGQKVREYFDRAREGAPSILFIDEIDAVAAKRDSRDTDSFTKDIVDELLTQMEGASEPGKHVFVLGATNHKESIDPAILRRFSFNIEIPLPDTTQRRRLFEIFLAKKPNREFEVNPIAAELAEKSKGMSGSDIQKLVEAAAQLSFQRAMETHTTDHIILKREDLMAQLVPQGKEVSEADIEKSWSQIVLKPEIKDSIMTKIRMFTSNDPAAPRGLLLFGPSGTGKTEIARRISDSAGSHFMPLTSSDLKSKYASESAEFVRKKWEEARSYPRCIMFIDECEGVFSTRGGLDSDKSSDDAVREFLAMWDGMQSQGQVWVVGATNRRDQIDDAILSRFGAAVEIGLPGPDERIQIAQLEMQKLGRGDVAVPNFVGPDTNGFSGRKLSSIAKDVCTLAAERKTLISPELWKLAISRQREGPSDTPGGTGGWDELVLPDGTIRQLKTICKSLNNIELLKKQGMNIPRGALLYGPPGTGKTQVARTLATESGLTVLLKGPADVKAGYVGQSVIKTKELFTLARNNAPSILFIDEFDSVAAARGSSWADQFTDEIVPTMLDELDGAKGSDRHVFLLVATNFRERIDPALRDRFTYEIEIPKPDSTQRQRLIKIFLGQKQVDFDIEHVTAELAERVGDVGGREIQNIVKRAEQEAIDRAFSGDTPEPIVIRRDDLFKQVGA